MAATAWRVLESKYPNTTAEFITGLRFPATSSAGTGPGAKVYEHEELHQRALASYFKRVKPQLVRHSCSRPRHVPGAYAHLGPALCRSQVCPTSRESTVTSRGGGCGASLKPSTLGLPASSWSTSQARSPGWKPRSKSPCQHQQRHLHPQPHVLHRNGLYPPQADRYRSPQPRPRHLPHPCHLPRTTQASPARHCRPTRATARVATLGTVARPSRCSLNKAALAPVMMILRMRKLRRSTTPWL